MSKDGRKDKAKRVRYRGGVRSRNYVSKKGRLIKKLERKRAKFLRYQKEKKKGSWSVEGLEKEIKTQKECLEKPRAIFHESPSSRWMDQPPAKKIERKSMPFEMGKGSSSE